MIEYLHATRIRIAAETSPGSGTATGNWIEPPCTAATAKRQIRSTQQRVTPWRQIQDRAIIGDSHRIDTAHEIGLAWTFWLLDHHTSARADGTRTLDPEATGPTFVLDTESQSGYRSRYGGVALTELALTFEEARIQLANATWSALWRDSPETALPDPDERFSGALLASMRSQLAATDPQTAWSADPRGDQPLIAHAAQLFLRRDITATDWALDGRPERHSRAPWRVTGEIYLPETPWITEAAMAGHWNGRLGFWFDHASEQHLRLNQTHGFVTDNDLKAWDTRTRRVVFEALADERRAILESR